MSIKRGLEACAAASRLCAAPRGSVPEEEVYEAALQFIRKISGYRVPSKANREAFDAAVAEVAEASRRLLDGLTVRG